MKTVASGVKHSNNGAAVGRMPDEVKSGLKTKAELKEASACQKLPCCTKVVDWTTCPMHAGAQSKCTFSMEIIVAAAALPHDG